MRSFILTASVAFLWLLRADGIPAASFSPVVDSVGVFNGFNFTDVGFSVPAINNQNQLVFRGTTTDGVLGVFLADLSSPTPTVTRIVDDQGIYARFDLDLSHFVSDVGIVAVGAERDDGATELFTVNASGTITRMVDDTAAFDSLTPAPDVNNSGDIVFLGELSTGEKGIFSASASTPFNTFTTIDDTTGVYENFFLPLTNGNGDIVYFGSDADAMQGSLVVAQAGGTTAPVLTVPFGTGIIPYDINNQRDVAYSRSPTGGNRTVEILFADMSSDTVVGPADGIPLLLPPDVAINDLGQVGFGADNRLVLADSAGVDTLLEVGDPLFDDTVSIVFAGKTISNAGQIPFIYQLDNGVVGIAVAVALLPADFDEDGDVDGDDFLAWQGGFGTQAGAAKADGDYDNDGDVDGDDFLGWQSEFGSGSGSSIAAVPEPSSWLLAAVGLTLCLTKRSGLQFRSCGVARGGRECHLLVRASGVSLNDPFLGIRLGARHPDFLRPLTSRARCQNSSIQRFLICPGKGRGMAQISLSCP